MAPSIRKKTPLYQVHLTRGERQRFPDYSRAALDHEIALLRVLNERHLGRLSAGADPEELTVLDRALGHNILLIARLMQIRAALGQAGSDERMDEIAANLRRAFTRPEPPNRLADMPGQRRQ